MNDSYTWKDLVRDELSRRGAPTPEKYVEKLAERIKIDNSHWNAVLEYGCQDPFWSDGVNLNLIKSHIIAHRFCIKAACELYRIQLPAEYYLPVPPDVNRHYMANGIIPDEVVKTGTGKEQFEWNKRLERRERFAKNPKTTHEKPKNTLTLGELQLTFI